MQVLSTDLYLMSHTRLFVSNLPDSTNEEDLRNAFSTYGEVVNLDIKTKSEVGSNPNKFAFVTLSACNYEVETCIKQLSNEDFNGSKIYVTRARESFLERLQREREQAKQKTEAKNEQSKNLPASFPIVKLGDKLNPRKRKFDNKNELNEINSQSHKICKNIDLHENPFVVKTSHEDFKFANSYAISEISSALHKINKKDDFYEKSSSAKKYIKVGSVNNIIPLTDEDKKKHTSDLKRIESMTKKRQEFRQKKNIIKSGLGCIDKVKNKKIIFSDGEDEKVKITGSDKSDTLTTVKKKAFLEDEDDLSDEEVLGNIELRKQFETKNGQRILDLQSRYKSEKRFILDERYFEEDPADEEEKQRQDENNDKINLNQTDEKVKQLNILQDILGVELKSRNRTELNTERKKKPALGMLRFDPMQPEHAKFLVPIETKNKQDNSKKSKKRKDKKVDEISEEPMKDEKRVEISQEKFYKDSETLKDISLVQPIQFSLRSLFANTDEDQQSEKIYQDTGYTEIDTKNNKVKNPLLPKEKNPFVYDSSDTESEDEDVNKQQKAEFPQNTEKAVWNENLFFSKSDERLKEGLLFFNNKSVNETQKDRRELKYLMKKRANNNEKKNQMFQKKIGGKKKAVRKFRKTNKSFN